jgi:hypothetical protein
MIHIFNSYSDIESKIFEKSIHASEDILLFLCTRFIAHWQTWCKDSMLVLWEPCSKTSIILQKGQNLFWLEEILNEERVTMAAKWRRWTCSLKGELRFFRNQVWFISLCLRLKIFGSGRKKWQETSIILETRLEEAGVGLRRTHLRGIPQAGLSLWVWEHNILFYF